MKWVGHEAHMEGREMYAEVWWGNLKERDHLEDLGIYRRIILR